MDKKKNYNQPIVEQTEMIATMALCNVSPTVSHDPVPGTEIE